MYHNPLGDYGAELRRQRRIEALMMQQMMTPATQFQQRQQNLIQRSQPRAQPKYNLPKFDWASLKAQGRFYGPQGLKQNRPF